MALHKGALVLFLARISTVCFAVAALKTWIYNPDHFGLRVSAFGYLDFFLGCHITASLLEVIGQSVSLKNGWMPIPSNIGLRLLLNFLDFLLAVCTLGAACATVGCTGWLRNLQVLVQPTVGRVLWHGGLAVAAGLSGLVSAVSSYCIAFSPPLPPELQ